MSEQNKKNLIIVGVGASAGGLQALKDMFSKNVTIDNTSFILVQHLSPDHKSTLKEILQPVTPYVVRDADNEQEIEEGCIYLCPAGKKISVIDSKIYLENLNREKLNFPIDGFFKSLAEDFGDRCIAVILSGSGQDGSTGILEVSNRNGYVICQDPTQSQFDGMPLSAIRSGAVNNVCPAEEILDEIRQQISLEIHDALASDVIDLKNEQHLLMEVFQLVQGAFSVDLNLYKGNTLYRRIRYRMKKLEVYSLHEYLNFIYDDPSELDRLLNDLLIPVTCFFRDQPFFDEIYHRVLPILFENKGPDTPLRVWCTACSTGQEPYSMAILISEYLKNFNITDRSFTILATDINPRVIEKASQGVYTAKELESLNPELLNKYFKIKGNNKYEIDPGIRNKIIFSIHNLIDDIPFTKIDLAVCRNFLVYLKKESQVRVLENIFFSLNIKGYLGLGPSESLLSLEECYDHVSVKWHIFRKKILPKNINLINNRGRASLKMRINTSLNLREKAQSLPTKSQANTDVDDSILAYFIRSGIFVDSSGDITHIFGDGKHILGELKSGKLSPRIENIKRKELKIIFDGLIDSSSPNKDAIRYQGAMIDGVPFNLLIKSILVDEGSLVHIIKFEKIHRNEEKTKGIKIDADSKSKRDGALTKVVPVVGHNDFVEEGATTELDVHLIEFNRIQTLERQLLQSKLELEESLQELALTNEELQTSNEELMSSNEELQSTNEELHMTNAQSQEIIKALTLSKMNVDNILESVGLITIFLDRKQRIIRFTSNCSEIIKLVESDVNRSIFDFSWRLKNFNLKDIFKSLDRQQHKKYITAVETLEGKRFSLNVNIVDDVLEGFENLDYMIILSFYHNKN